MDYAQVAVPAAAVRRKPSHQREMSNQLLFGEAVKILREKKVPYGLKSEACMMIMKVG